MPVRYGPRLTSWSQPISNSNHSSSFPDSFTFRQNDLDAVLRGDLVLYTSFTDDEDENNPPNYFSGVSNLEPLSPDLDEDVITRTGEVSRLRRRGALHGRRPQYTYTTLSCGVELPWRFKFEAEDGLENWNSKSLPTAISFQLKTSNPIRAEKPPLEFPSTGCGAVLTSCALVSSHHNVYTASESMDIVTPVEEIYLTEEQTEVVEQFLINVPGCSEWRPVACRQCGNVVGLQYSQIFQDENGNPLEDAYGRVTITRFAFFPSTVTSSKPYNFAEGKFYPESINRRLPSSRPVSTSSAGLSSRGRRSIDPRRPGTLYQEPPPISPQDRPDPIHVRLPLVSRSDSSTHSLSLHRLSSEGILPSIPESSSGTAGPAQEERNADDWASWMPNPYVYSSEGEDEEIIERELGQRRLRLSEAISILQTTHEEFMPNRQNPDDALNEAENEAERPSLDDVIASPAEDTHQSLTLNFDPLDESAQVSNPYPYTHSSSSAPVPSSISTRIHEVHRLDQQISNGVSRPESEHLPPPLSSSTESFDLHRSDQIQPMPTHLVISDIAANNCDTGEVESNGILEPPPQNATSSFGSAVIVPSLIDGNEHVPRHTSNYIHVTPSPEQFFSSSSGQGNVEQNNSSRNPGFEIPMARDREELYTALDEQYQDFDSKVESLFNIDAPARELPNAISEVNSFDFQSANLTAFREYTPSLPPLSPGALATPSLPYSPTTSVPLPPTLLPLMEILDSIDMEVLSLARYSDIEDSDSESETSDTDSKSEDHQSSRDDSVYTTELPWDRYDPDPQWLDYGESPVDSQLSWSTESMEPVLPFSALEGSE